ncbi:hypothetical protein [Yinghuangia sp. YIM S10712]|uniref:hypothetical protein n=1 Tax=Yinghuangia sp. YIM S10712 TaxID=3436930 RepID=UPI003F5361F8
MSTQNQPRWAWWVVGILIPLLGIGVSIWVAGKSDSDDKADVSATAPADTTGGAGGSAGAPTSAPPAAQNNAPAKVLYGPGELTVDPDSQYVVLDAEAPIAQSGEQGAELNVLFNVPPVSMITTDHAETIAALPAGGADPTAAECAEAVSKRGSDSGELAPGNRYCVKTTGGRTAYVEPTRVSFKAVTFRIIIWG